MIKTAYHATNNLSDILDTGKVMPMRMFNVFLCAEKVDAFIYAERFGCSDVVEVNYETLDVESAWRPAYIDKGKVIKLKPGCHAVAIGKV